MITQREIRDKVFIAFFMMQNTMGSVVSKLLQAVVEPFNPPHYNNIKYQTAPKGSNLPQKYYKVLNFYPPLLKFVKIVIFFSCGCFLDLYGRSGRQEALRISGFLPDSEGLAKKFIQVLP